MRFAGVRLHQFQPQIGALKSIRSRHRPFGGASFRVKSGAVLWATLTFVRNCQVGSQFSARPIFVEVPALAVEATGNHQRDVRHSWNRPRNVRGVFCPLDIRQTSKTCYAMLPPWRVVVTSLFSRPLALLRWSPGNAERCQNSFDRRGR